MEKRTASWPEKPSCSFQRRDLDCCRNHLAFFVRRGGIIAFWDEKGMWVELNRDNKEIERLKMGGEVCYSYQMSHSLEAFAPNFARIMISKWLLTIENGIGLECDFPSHESRYKSTRLYGLPEQDLQ